MNDMTDAEKFRGFQHHADNGCIEWTGYRLPKGYGRFRARGGQVYAHRWAYEEQCGPIPDGLHIDHLCRNPSCVNVEHLEAVTPGENTRRGRAFEVIRERAANRTHCPKGHEFSGENVVVRRDGKRYCRECKRASARAWYQANSEKGRAYTARYRAKKKGEVPDGYHENS